MADSKPYWTKCRKIRANVKSYGSPETSLDNDDTDDDPVVSIESHGSRPPRRCVSEDVRRCTGTSSRGDLDYRYEGILTTLEEIKAEMRQMNSKLNKALVKFASVDETDDDDDEDLEWPEEVVLPVPFTEKPNTALVKFASVDETDDDLELPEEVVLPVPSIEALLTLEEHLGQPSCEQVLITTLGTIGGRDSKDIVRRILKYVLSHAVALQLNWTGRGEKTAFAGLRLKDVLSKAVRRNRDMADTTEHEIDTTVKKWLAGAPDRNGGRNKRY